MEIVRITQSVYTEIMNTIGNYAPETGGALGEKNGVICRYFFDEKAIGNKNSYSPTTDSINEVIDEWEKDEIRFAGIIHSHPGTMKRLSYADVYYAQCLLKQNETESILFPIVVHGVGIRICMYKVFLGCDVKECGIKLMDA